MSEPFDFNTPITENTTLVARYRCGEAPYGGQWFRWTDKDGNQYVPTNINEAEQIFSGKSGDNTYYNLVNVDTGRYENVQTANITKLEFGGGWRPITMSAGNSLYFNITAIYNVTGNTYPTLKISGYPSGLVPTGSYPFMYFTFNQTLGISVDYTGFSFNKAQYNSLILNQGLFNLTPTNIYVSGGGGCVWCATAIVCCAVWKQIRLRCKQILHDKWRSSQLHRWDRLYRRICAKLGTKFSYYSKHSAYLPRLTDWRLHNGAAV